MSCRGWFALLMGLVISVAGCAKAAPEPEKPNNIDGPKVYNALSSALLKAATGRATATGKTPGESPAAGGEDLGAPDAP